MGGKTKTAEKVGYFCLVKNLTNDQLPMTNYQ
jgi:hypothetical protein